MRRRRGDDDAGHIHCFDDAQLHHFDDHLAGVEHHLDHLYLRAAGLDDDHPDRHRDHWRDDHHAG